MRESILKVRIAGPGITLDDLRWLVEECKGYAAASRVEIHERKDLGQRESTVEEVIVHGTPGTQVKPPLGHVTYRTS